MHDADPVRRLQPLGDLPAHVERLVHRQRAALEARRQVFPGHELHRDEARVVDLVDAEDRGHVGMVQRREDLRLALEATEPLVVVGQLLGQHLDRDLAIEAGVLGSVDLAHPPGSERAEDLVVRQGLADGERHPRGV